jgi:predicted transcriptional regulator
MASLSIELSEDCQAALAELASSRGQTSEQLAAAMISGVIREIVLKKIEREYFNPDEVPEI